MGVNPRKFQHYTLKTVGGVVFTRICYIYIWKYLRKGHNSFRKGRIKKSSLYAQLHTMGVNPRKFQHNPMQTIGGVVFTLEFAIYSYGNI